MKILFVEDDLMTIEAIVDHLQIEKHSVEIVSTIEDAIDRVENNAYDVIFSDIMFAPGTFFTPEETADGRYSGLKFVEHIRDFESRAGKNRSKIIMVTNWRGEPRIDAVAEKCNAVVLRKPLSIKSVKEALNG